MPARRRTTRSRNEWTDGHLSQLAFAHDYFNDAWGRLDKLPPDELAEVVDEMKRCWWKHADEVREMATPK
jgi:hypothetical protein